jgi:citrate lyase subunit beta/citryl-CoA lyase
MRSLLFVPGHDARKLARGLHCGADALIVDLEDAVPPAHKAAARESAAGFIATHRGSMPLLVRVNALDTGLLLDDLAAVVRAQPHAVMLPKCRGAEDVARVGHCLDALEAREGLPVGGIGILPIATESALATLGLESYARSPSSRLQGLLWGGEDLAADLGTANNRDAQGRYTAPFAMARALALLGATAAGVAAIDAVYTDFRDAEGLRAEAAEAVRDGFTGKAAIHPDQVAVIHSAFTPAPDAVAWARRVVAAFDAAPGQGAIAIDGRMLDRPHLRGAQRVLARAAAPGTP